MNENERNNEKNLERDKIKEKRDDALDFNASKLHHHNNKERVDIEKLVEEENLSG